MNEIEKIKYHIRLLSQAIDSRANPVASLVISNDWTEEDLDAAHDIFEKYDNKLNIRDGVNWYDFENDFKIRFEIGYQNLKSIVLAFFRNNQWVDVCLAYAQAHPCLEFSEITRNLNHKIGKALEERVSNILIRNNIPYSRDITLDMADGKHVILDFLVKFPSAKIALEVKRQLDERFLSNISLVANAVHASKSADDFWVVVEDASEQDVIALSERFRLKIYILNDFEAKLEKAD